MKRFLIAAVAVAMVTAFSSRPVQAQAPPVDPWEIWNMRAQLADQEIMDVDDLRLEAAGHGLVLSLSILAHQVMLSELESDYATMAALGYTYPDLATSLVAIGILLDGAVHQREIADVYLGQAASHGTLATVHFEIAVLNAPNSDFAQCYHFLDLARESLDDGDLVVWPDLWPLPNDFWDHEDLADGLDAGAETSIISAVWRGYLWVSLMAAGEIPQGPWDGVVPGEEPPEEDPEDPDDPDDPPGNMA